jgi:hypothetical protein
VQDDPSRAISGFARDVEADLVVVGHKRQSLACKFDQYVPDHVDALSHIGMSRDQPVEQASYISAEENMVVGGLRVKQRRDRIPVTAVQR